MDETAIRSTSSEAPDRGVAAVGTIAGAGALFSAAACCVLPLVLAALGVGAGGLAAFVPFHWPMTIAAAVAITLGWLLYLRKRRHCAADASCGTEAPKRGTLIMLTLATVFVLLSALWPSFLEKPLMKLLGGA